MFHDLDTQLGFSPLDRDHEELLRLACLREDPLLDDAPQEEICKRLTELTEFTGHHFRREEHYMEATGYPGLDAHRREHSEILEWLLHLCMQMPDTRCTSKQLSEKIVAVLVAWIGAHLETFDSALVEFMRSQRDQFKSRRNEGTVLTTF